MVFHVLIWWWDYSSAEFKNSFTILHVTTFILKALYISTSLNVRDSLLHYGVVEFLH